MATRITGLKTHDVRFPTLRTLAGSDAMNPDPDYSAAYVVLETDHPSGLAGHGLTFTIGRGTELCIAAVKGLARHVVGCSMEEIAADMSGFWRRLVADTQLRWLGPEKGVVHLAAAALVNAVWDLYAKLQGKALWKLLADMTPEQLVACVDFRYIEDALTAAEALDILQRQAPSRPDREAEILRRGFPAYTTSAGWLGYPEDKIGALTRRALADGFTHIKLKVGADPETDLRRARLLRRAMGPDRRLMLDANQVWGVDQAIAAVAALAEVDPWWIEEPTSPDDVLGHRRIRDAVAPIRVATGEHVQNRVVFKQLFQLGAIDFCQIDACRLGGVNEVLAVLLLAAKFGVPICPHGGGVGAVRVRAAPGDLRLRRGGRLSGRPGLRVRGASSRALPGPMPRGERALRGAEPSRLQRRDASGIAFGVRLSGGSGLAGDVRGGAQMNRRRTEEEKKSDLSTDPTKHSQLGVAGALAGLLSVTLTACGGGGTSTATSSTPKIGVVLTFNLPGFWSNYLSVWVPGAIFLVFGLFLRYHRAGRAIYAIGGNVEAARAAGIKVDRIRIAVFAVGSVLAAVGGLMESGQVTAVTAGQGSNLIFGVFAAAVIGGVSLDGGRGRMVGALTGVILLALVTNILVLTNIPSYWISAVDGIIILVALAIARVISAQRA